MLQQDEPAQKVAHRKLVWEERKEHIILDHLTTYNSIISSQLYYPIIEF